MRRIATRTTMSNLPPALRRRLAGHSGSLLPPTFRLRQSSSWWLGSLTFACVSAAIAVFGALAIILLAPAREKIDGINELRPSVIDDTSATTARLLVTDQKGLVNEPLALGLAIENASGDETVTLIGLAAGTNVAPGSPLGLTGWRVTGRDLADVRAYPPKDFVGSMEATAKLVGVRNQVFDNQIVRLRWKKNTSDGLVAAPASPQAQAAEARDPEDSAALLQHAEELLNQGDIASARPLLRPASDVDTEEASDLGERLAGWELRTTTAPSSDARPQPPEGRLATVEKPKSRAVREGLITKAPANR
jgi:hypothetical protein